jgi:hypothetical protein
MNTQLQQARSALAKGDQTTAQALAGAVLKEDPQNGEAWFLLGEATEGDRKLLFMKKAQKLDPLNQEYTARIAELTAPPPPPPPPAPEPEPADSWDDFDMAALADTEDDGEPIDTSAIMVDDAPPAKKPAPAPEPEPTPAPTPVAEPKPAAVAATTTAATTKTSPTPSQKKEKPAPADKKGMDWDFIGMVGFGALAVLLLVIAFWLLFFAG